MRKTAPETDRVAANKDAPVTVGLRSGNQTIAGKQDDEPDNNHDDKGQRKLACSLQHNIRKRTV